MFGCAICTTIELLIKPVRVNGRRRRMKKAGYQRWCGFHLAARNIFLFLSKIYHNILFETNVRSVGILHLQSQYIIFMIETDAKKSRLGQNFTITKKSSIFCQSLRNFVKMISPWQVKLLEYQLNWIKVVDFLLMVKF